MADYKIQLGIELNNKQFSDIKRQLNNLTDNTHRIRIDIDNSRLLKQIEHAKKELKGLNTTKGSQPSLDINTKTLEQSLGRVADSIDEVIKSLGTLDKKSGMQSLVTSVNQIAIALGKAEDESDSLIKSLNNLSKKDFSLNIGVKLGGSNSVANNAAYGDFVKDEVLPALKKQEQELTKYIAKHFNTNEISAINKLAGKDLGGISGIIDTLDRLESPLKKGESLKDRMRDFKNFINTITNAANVQGIDLSPVLSQFEKLPNELIESADKIKNGTKQVDDSFEKIKNIFGGGIGAEQLSAQLEPIVTNLKSIREAIENLSKGVSFDGLTGSFDRLSGSIENLLTNAEKVKGILNSDFKMPSINTKIGSGTVSTTSRKKTSVQDSGLDSYLDYYNIKGDNAKVIKGKFKSLVESSGSLDSGSYDAAVEDLVDTIKQLGAVSKQADDYLEKVFNTLRTYNIDAPKDIYKQEFGDDWSTERAKHQAILANKNSKTRINVDSAYEELKELFPSLFPEDIINASDQLKKIFEVYDIAKDASKNKIVGVSEEYGDSYLKQEVLDIVNTMQEQVKAEKELAQSSAQTTNSVAQDEATKRQEYEKTLAQKKQELDELNRLEKEYSDIISDPTKLKSDTFEEQKNEMQMYLDSLDYIQNQKKELEAEIKQFDSVLNSYEKISKDTSLVRDKVDFQKTFAESNQAAQEAQKHFQELLADEKAVVSVTEQFDDSNALQSFVVNIQRASGEVETLRYAMDKLNDGESKDFKYQGGSTSDGKVEKQLEARIKKANDLQIKLDKIKSGYSDLGAAKPIKDDDHIKVLSNQYDKVKNAIIDVRNADDSTFSSMVSNAEKEKAALENMVREFRNAENVATSLRSKDIDTVKSTYASKLDVLVSKMQSSGVYTDGFEKGAENLRSVLSGATDSSGLVKFLNGLDKLEAGYKRADAAAKEFNKSQKVGINVSGLESKIADLQRISPEIDKFETEINGAKVSVKSLLNDLSQVKTQGDFSVVNSKWRAFTDAAKAAGIAVSETATRVKSVKDIKIKLADTGFDGFKAEIERVKDAAFSLEGTYDGLENALKQLDIAFDAVNTANEVNDIQRLVAANEQYENALKQVNSQLKLYQKKEKLDITKANLNAEMENWLKENSRAAKDFGAEIKKLQASLNGLDESGVRRVGQQFKFVKSQAKAFGKTGLTVFDQLKSKVKEYSVYFSAAEIFMYAEQAMRSMFNAVKEIDTAMTGLYRVTDLTEAQYDTLFNNMIDSAKEYGATLNDIINATTDWVRAGFDADTSLGLAEVTTMYQHISDLDYDTAAENLITAYNGFKDELNGAFDGDTVAAVNYIADILNELDKQNCP